MVSLFEPFNQTRVGKTRELSQYYLLFFKFDINNENYRIDQLNKFLKRSHIDGFLRFFTIVLN